MVRATLILVALLVALLVTGCGDGTVGGDGPDVTGEWALVEGTADGAALPSSGATLQLANGEAGGVSFCNHYFGTYRLTGDAVVFEGLGGTEIGCETDVMAAERAYLAGLGAVDTAAVEADALVLTGEGVRLRFTPAAPVPDSPLEATRWVLDTLVEGEVASSTLCEPAVLQLDPDRTAAASTGCRSITGTWLLEDGALIIDDLLADDPECPADVLRQDAHVTAVPQSGPAVEIRENKLTLTAADGRGLVYRVD
jgi:heat shock protein HslJ